MTDILQYIIITVLFGFLTLYCAVQSVTNLRERRYGLGSAGVISALFALFWVITMAYNVALRLGTISSVRVIN